MFNKSVASITGKLTGMVTELEKHADAQQAKRDMHELAAVAANIEHLLATKISTKLKELLS